MIQFVFIQNKKLKKAENKFIHMCECLKAIGECGKCLVGCRGIIECVKGCEEGAGGDCPKWLIQLCVVIVCIAICFYPIFLFIDLFVAASIYINSSRL